MASRRPAPGHAVDPDHRDPAVAARRPLGRVLLVAATTTLAVTLLPGTAVADPERAATPEQAVQLVARAGHELEVVSEQVNEARETLAGRQAAAEAAHVAAVTARRQLHGLDGQIRQVARSAFTGENLTELELLLTSGSAEDFVSRLATLDAIAGHTGEVIAQVSASATAAEQAQAEADEATGAAQRALDEVAARQAELEADIADYRAQYDALTVAQQEVVVAAHGGQAIVTPAPAAAPGGAAQVAVDTALGQVGDPYVWGAGGPDAFDCSGLTQYAYAAAGITLPHSSRMQSQLGTAVSRADLQPGDLIFYRSPVSHVSMYIGNGQMVHASTSGQPVEVVAVDSMGGITAMRRVA
ncbi:C40 family peptidase [Geodermatophilus marinus]|uniref:C40 family peptidase n=1 Tax=Geodermatophilus sp. LHW52908 TaxID=2303986 RepID=UPI000E3E1147|nr:C40 family peptidase [Geodermatophilus sp. LHW52908]RFU22530.1 NlpC/P60 family protein [Geodermatophilus sp. LHW52908]